MATENNDLNVSELFLRFSRGNLCASLKRIKTEESLTNDRIRGQALHALKIGLSLARDVWPETVQLLIEMSPKMEQGGYWNEWIRYLEQGIELSQSFEDEETEAELKLELGLLHKYRGNHDKARDCFEICIKIFEKLTEFGKQAKALCRLAHIICLQGKHEEAKALGNQALVMMNGNKDEQAYCYSVLGVISYEEQNWELATHYLLICLEQFQEQNNQREVARSLQNLGVIAQVQENYDEAISYYQKAIFFFTKAHDPVHLAVTQMNLGIIYSQKNQYTNSLNLYESSELIFQKIRGDLCLALIYTNKAQLYRAIQKWEQAKYTCLAAIRYWQSLNDIWNLVNTMDELGLIYADQMYYSKAIGVFRDGLNRLNEIPEHPRYDMLYKLLAEHIQTYSSESKDE